MKIRRRGFIQNVVASIATVCVATFVPDFVEPIVIDYPDTEVLFIVKWAGGVMKIPLSYNAFEMEEHNKLMEEPQSFDSIEVAVCSDDSPIVIEYNL